MEEEKSVRNNEVVVKNFVEPNKSDIAEPLEKVDRKDEVEDRTNDEQVRSTETDLTGEKVRELVETPRLTDEELVETDIRLSLASQSHIYPLGIAKDVLVEITGFIYPMDFVILDIKEDKKRTFILGTPFLTTVKAEIREKDEIDTITPISIVSKRILEWEEKIKFRQDKSWSSINRGVDCLTIRIPQPQMTISLLKTKEESRKDV
ncbi:zinc finger, CCHC-type containing protein [Tanacetum coccineum]|uniref:Zinc finger, CCHC-type containing protein n=1 Tax=Tanacetum coccineum TaxID=301880 RepID=A0ABQ5EX35_9ASTR